MFAIKNKKKDSIVENHDLDELDLDIVDSNKGKDVINTDYVDKKRLKQLEENMTKSRKKKTVIAKSTQQTIPFSSVYDNGLFKIEDQKYSKTIVFSDVNYQVAREDVQVGIFYKWANCLNYFGPDVEMSYTIHNKVTNAEKRLDKIKLQENQNLNNELVQDYNQMLTKQFYAGRNDILREKYMTISLCSDSPESAEQRFIKHGQDIIALLSKTGSIAHVQSSEERLEILHDIFRPNAVGEMKLDWNNIVKQGQSAKDYISPASFEFKRDYFRIDDMYYRCAYVTNLPESMIDTFLSELTAYSFPMLCTTSIQVVDMQKAQKLVKRQLTGMRAMKIDYQKKAAKSNYDPELSIPDDLKYAYEEAETLLKKLRKNNEKMFNVTIGIMLSGNTLQELEENFITLSGVTRTYICQLQKMIFQQEEGMKQILPLGHNTLPLRRTLTTESLGAFIPFTSQELIQDKGIYYSLNAVTKNLIIADRKALNNANGFVLGESGAGKSFIVKKEIVAKYLSDPNKFIFIIDPEGEYVDLIEQLGGQNIKISVSSNTNINLCDMDQNYALEGDAIAEKTNFFLSVCESITHGLTPAQRTIVDRVIPIIYREYLENYDLDKLPTFVDFYEMVKKQPEDEAKNLAIALEIFATGGLSLFAKKTNVNLKNRLVNFDISGLGVNLKDLGLLVISELIWNTVCSNIKQLKNSISVYIDEFHLMFKNATSEDFAEQLYARIRKYGGDVTGSTQNVDTLLKSEKARGMLSNSLFTILLSQSDTNRKILSDMFDIGEEQLSYITNAEKGTGLIRSGKIIVPFADEYPKDTILYKLMTTDPDEKKMYELEKRQKALMDAKIKRLNQNTQ